MAEKNKKDIKEKFTEMLVLPKEILLDLPKITITGNQQLFIENYKGIVEYESEKIRINCTNSLIKIFGENLEINTVTSEEVYITGKINSIEFED